MADEGEEEEKAEEIHICLTPNFTTVVAHMNPPNSSNALRLGR